MKTAHAALVSAALLFATTLAPAQTNAPAKPLAFATFSVRPSAQSGTCRTAFTSNGYSASCVSLGDIVLQADSLLFDTHYRQFRDALAGAPDWLWQDKWDVQATVAPGDLAAFQQASSPGRNPVGSQMLQAMLAACCGLVTHPTLSDQPGYLLTLDKGGPNFALTVPKNQSAIRSTSLAGGGFVSLYHQGDAARCDFYSVSMASFAAYLAQRTQEAVIDQTGLTGNYDFSLAWIGGGDHRPPTFYSSDSTDPLSNWSLHALGLKAKRTNIPTRQIVIDHIDRPAPN